MQADTYIARQNGKERTIRLPDLPDVRGAGSKLVERTVMLVLLLTILGLVLAFTIMALVTIDLTVDAYGEVEPAILMPIRPLQSGLVADLRVSAGDTVRAGDVLARLDSLSLVQSLARLEAERTSLVTDQQHRIATMRFDTLERRHARAQAEADLLRTRAVLRERIAGHGFGTDVDTFLQGYVPGTHVEVDKALADVRREEAVFRAADMMDERAALAHLDLDRHEAERARLAVERRSLLQQFDRLRITAPISGVVVTEHLEYLHGALVREGETLLEIAAPDDWRVVLFVRSRDVYEIRPGDRAQVEIQAFRGVLDDRLLGRVATVAAEPETDDVSPARAGLYRVTVVLDREGVEHVGNSRLRRGFNAQGKIITRSGSILYLLWRYLTEHFPEG